MSRQSLCCASCQGNCICRGIAQNATLSELQMLNNHRGIFLINTLSLIQNQGHVMQCNRLLRHQNLVQDFPRSGTICVLFSLEARLVRRPVGPNNRKLMANSALL